MHFDQLLLIADRADDSRSRDYLIQIFIIDYASNVFIIGQDIQISCLDL